MKTTNYLDTFIEVAPDCPVEVGEIPPQKGEVRTAASIQYELIQNNPYQYTSDDVLFEVFAIKNKVGKKDQKEEREKFFSKGQPCFRSSPLTKRYGWGVHSDSSGRMALYAVDSPQYKKLSAAKNCSHVKAMRAKKQS